MKTVILAGGLGTRISEESHLTPKPMIEIGGKPILWHIMKIYSSHGFNDFIICCGYKGNLIKQYFADYYLYNSDVTFDFSGDNQKIIHSSAIEPWRVTLVDTGLSTMTGGRIKRVQPYIDDDVFMLSYGDGVSNVDIVKLVEFHKAHGKIATITAVTAGQRFGLIKVDSDDSVSSFREKFDEDGGLINGGFMVLDSRVFDYLEGDETIFERAPLEKLASNGELMAFKHGGYWDCMDTQRDKDRLNSLWETNSAPWKVWQ